jgi:hypothetical protein
MLGYMATVSYVNRLALSGRSRFLRSDFNSAKFLKTVLDLSQLVAVYVHKRPRECGRLPQSEQTGCPVIGSLQSLMRK